MKRFARILLVLFLVCASGLPASAAVHARGDHVPIRGRLSGADGEPVGDVTVLLEVSRKSFQLRELGPGEKEDTLRIPGTTNAAGEFEFSWRWDPYYNVFELAVAVPVKKDGRDDFEVLEQRDITREVEAGSPVQIDFVLKNRPYLDWLRRFLANLASPDERRLYEERGRPDRIETGTFSGVAETTWWYFPAGKAYRFRDGSLQQVVHFEPVK